MPTQAMSAFPTTDLDFKVVLSFPLNHFKTDQVTP